MNRRCMRGLYERGDAAGVDARRGGGHDDGRASFVCTSTRLDLLTAPQPYHETTHAAPDAHHPITANRTIQPAKRAPRTIPPHRLTNPMARHAPARAHARLADGCSHLPLCCPLLLLSLFTSCAAHHLSRALPAQAVCMPKHNQNQQTQKIASSVHHHQKRPPRASLSYPSVERRDAKLIRIVLRPLGLDLVVAPPA